MPSFRTQMSHDTTTRLHAIRHSYLLVLCLPQGAEPSAVTQVQVVVRYKGLTCVVPLNPDISLRAARESIGRASQKSILGTDLSKLRFQWEAFEGCVAMVLPQQEENRLLRSCLVTVPNNDNFYELALQPDMADFEVQPTAEDPFQTPMNQSSSK